MLPTPRSLSRWTKVGCVAIALSGVGTAIGAENGAWRHDSIWDDGNAEFATYEITWPRYGDEFSGRAILVLVKEPWAPDLHVKADTPRPDGFDVLKLNHLRDVPTGIYTYHQIASMFVRRDTAELVKLATSSAEACGVSTANLLDGKLATHSYFDGQGDQQVRWPRGALPQAGLPALLRDYVLGEAPANIQVFTSLLTARFGELRAQDWKLKKRFIDSHQVPAGSFPAYEIELRRKDQHMTYVFDAVVPHVLLEYHSSNSTDYKLVKVERIPYWGMHRPGDESWYPPALRESFGR